MPLTGEQRAGLFLFTMKGAASGLVGLDQPAGAIGLAEEYVGLFFICDVFFHDLLIYL